MGVSTEMKSVLDNIQGNEEKIRIVDELFDAFDQDKDNMWSEDEFSEYFVQATRLERVWAQLAGDHDVVEKPVMQEYIERIFTSKATHKISAFVAVTQGLALTSPNMKAYTSEMAESFEYPVTWESFKISQVHAAWVNLPGPKYDGLASEETMINSFFGATKDIANRMEAVEITAVASDFDTVGDLIEELSGVAERRRASMEEAIADGTMCMFGAIGDVFFGPLSVLMSTIGCVDLMLNASGECGWEDAFIPGSGVLSCLASFVPASGLANNIDCIINNVQTIVKIGTDKPPKCQWFGSAPDCGNPRCTSEYPQKRAYDDCGDGNKCQSGTKIHCCEKYTIRKAELPTVPPAMRIWNSAGDSKPICRISCNIGDDVCYKCSNGVGCNDCHKMPGSSDCRPEYCYQPADKCTNWKEKYACSGSIIGDYNLSTKEECVRECRQNSRCNCVMWGVNSSKKCRLETGTWTGYHGNSRYSAISMNECFYG